MNGQHIQAAIGLENLAVPVSLSLNGYLQGGWGLYSGDRTIAYGRTWFWDVDEISPYSYIDGAFPANEVFILQGFWKPRATYERVALWLLSHATSEACLQQAFFIALPDI